MPVAGKRFARRSLAHSRKLLGEIVSFSEVGDDAAAILSTYVTSHGRLK